MQKTKKKISINYKELKIIEFKKNHVTYKRAIMAVYNIYDTMVTS